MSLLRTSSLLIALLVAIAPLRASAEPEDAKTLYKRGTALFALRKFEAAAALYEKAFELHNEPAILYNAAQAYRLAGNKARALELYQSLLQIYGTGFPNSAEANLHIKNLKKAIEADRHAAGSPPNVPMNMPRPEPTPPPVVVAAPAAALVVTTTPAPTKPITKRPWFWGVVAGGAAVVVGAVVVGVVIGTTKTVDPKPSISTINGDF